jgi:hypothetical protein
VIAEDFLVDTCFFIAEDVLVDNLFFMVEDVLVDTLILGRNYNSYWKW